MIAPLESAVSSRYAAVLLARPKTRPVACAVRARGSVPDGRRTVCWAAACAHLTCLCRDVQAVVAGLLLFIGITCQFWSGMSVNDVPLSSLCETYSGDPAVMAREDFAALFNWYETTVPQCSKRSCVPFDGAAAFFQLGQESLQQDGRTDMLRYADAHFYCKHVPKEVDQQVGTCLDKITATPDKDPQPCRLWPNQVSSPDDNSNWCVRTKR